MDLLFAVWLRFGLFKVMPRRGGQRKKALRLIRSLADAFFKAGDSTGKSKALQAIHSKSSAILD